MVDHRRRDEWAGRGRRRSRDASEELDEERALRDLQEQAGNRAVTGALESMHDPDPGTTAASSGDSPGLRLLGALRGRPAQVQRQAAGGLLRRGVRGPEVEALQADLARAGYALAVDGIFGPATQAAVTAFQRAAGLAVDGIAGPATRGALASGGKEVGKTAGKGGVAKEAWAPDETAKEAAAKKESEVAKEAWAPDETAKEAAAKKESEIAKEAWAPEDEDEAAAKGADATKATGETEKEDWWLT